MRSHMTQVILIALATLFAMALALTVSLICLSYGSTDAEENVPTDATPSPDDPPTTDVPSDKPPDVLPPAPADNGLSYSSNGNGTCTLIGVGSCLDTCIVIPMTSPSGDVVTSIAARAFYGCTFASAIQIPSTVSSIGALAFANCPNLLYISVDVNNYSFCDVDGVLYSADGTTLLVYPAMRAGANLTISSVTTEIADMAFYNCAYLSHVYYAGSAEQWERISIGTKNYSLTAASKTFYGTGR